MVTHTFDANAWETEADRSLLVQGQHRLCSEFQANNLIKIRNHNFMPSIFYLNFLAFI